MLFLLLFLSGSNYVATLTVGGAGAHASYYHKANDQVAFAFISPLCTQTVAFKRASGLLRQRPGTSGRTSTHLFRN